MFIPSPNIAKSKKKKVVKRDRSVFEILSTKDVSEHTRVLKVNNKNFALSKKHSLPFIIFSLYLKSFYFTAAIHCAVYQCPSA
jgi:hypothetical protein